MRLRIVKKRYEELNSTRIPQITQQMRRVVAVGGNLPLESISAAAGRSWDSLTLGAFRSVAEDVGNRLQPARIAEAGEDERHVAADVPILMTKPVCERRQHTRIAFAGDRSLEERADAVASTLNAMSAEASIMARCTGKTDVRNLEPEDVRAITIVSAQDFGVPLAGARKGTVLTAAE